jgi:hypothetical protein
LPLHLVSTGADELLVGGRCHVEAGVQEWKEVHFAVGYGTSSEPPEELLRELQAEVTWLREVEGVVRADLPEIEAALGHPWQAMRDLLGE